MPGCSGHNYSSKQFPGHALRDATNTKSTAPPPFGVRGQARASDESQGRQGARPHLPVLAARPRHGRPRASPYIPRVCPNTPKEDESSPASAGLLFHVFRIGIGGSLATPPLPHHRTYGSASGGSAD